MPRSIAWFTTLPLEKGEQKRDLWRGLSPFICQIIQRTQESISSLPKSPSLPLLQRGRLRHGNHLNVAVSGLTGRNYYSTSSAVWLSDILPAAPHV